jgi:uncharacterized damage-inducible protein DinB
MNPYGLAAAIGVFFLSFAPPAQTAATDPISGTWTGYIARDSNTTDRIQLTFALTLKDSVVSGKADGPKASPGILKNGTFDAATGAIAFDVEVQDAEKTFVAFDGKLTGDKMSGRVLLLSQPGVFSLLRSAVGADSPADAPALQGISTEEALQKSFAEVHGHIVKAAETIPPDKYTYQPAKSVRTVGQLLGHIADGYDYFCGRAQRRAVEWSDATANGPTDKAAIAAALKKAGAGCSTAYAGGGVPLLIQNLNHTNQHYGNIVTYMRMLGLTPPSSQ